MIKKVAAVVLILLASGVWFYLDYLNKQEQASMEQMHQSLEQAHAESKARAETKTK